MRICKSGIILIIGILTLVSCQKTTSIDITPDDYHNAVDRLIEVQIHNIFSPPQASRIFAYTNIAGYEVLAQNDPNYKSLSGQLRGLTSIPKPNTEDSINYKLASLTAYYELSKELVFTEDKIITFRDSIFNVWQKQDQLTFMASYNYGMQVASHIKSWMNKDNYAQTRSMPKFSVITEDEGRWQPTPPSYMDGIEPHWNKLRPFVIKTADQFKPQPPPAFSMEEGSDFRKELEEVYDISQDIAKEGDEGERIAIARFWDCNPYVSVQRGHLMFATKKITPGAHWIGITKIASKKTNADFNKTVYAYTKASIAMADAFISCWDEKYRSNLVRPETLINKHIDDSWEPVLQTPPFPEYVSGHSVVSGAASTVLTDIYGDHFVFADDTELEYGLPIRNFTSFNQAASEAAISRMYGGIHYRAAVDVGLKQGQDLGHYVIQELNMFNQ